MEQKTKAINRIGVFCTIAAIFTLILIITSFGLCFENIIAMSSLFKSIMLFYIIILINQGCSRLKYQCVFSSVIPTYARKIAYACWISGIGSSLLAILINSIQKKKVWIQFDLTILGIGFLLYAGAFVYEYGCQINELQEKHIDFEE